MIHELKTWPEFFDAILSGRKKFEVRKNDRNYKIGDELWLKEYLPECGELTGRIIAVKVTYILHGGEFGINKDFCVMSITRDF